MRILLILLLGGVGIWVLWYAIVCKKKIVCLVCIGIILFLGLYNIPFPRKISGNFAAEKWSMNKENIREKCTVSIEGKYMRYLLKEDVFRGHIALDDYVFTHKDSGYEMKDILLNSSPALRYRPIGEFFYTETLGEFYYDYKANKFIFLIFNNKPNGGKSWSGEDGVVITSPSVTLEYIQKYIF